ASRDERRISWSGPQNELQRIASDLSRGSFACMLSSNSAHVAESSSRPGPYPCTEKQMTMRKMALDIRPAGAKKSVAVPFINLCVITAADMSKPQRAALLAWHAGSTH